MFNGLNASGFGVVVSNDKGEVMAALAARGPSVQDSEEAEVLACRRAVEFAMEAGFTEIILEGDNVNVMKAIMGPGTNSSRLGYVYEYICCIGRGFRAFSVSHVRRTANCVAHSLAKFAKHIIGERIWMEESPPPALEALYVDSCNMFVWITSTFWTFCVSSGFFFFKPALNSLFMGVYLAIKQC